MDTPIDPVEDEISSGRDHSHHSTIRVQEKEFSYKINSSYKPLKRNLNHQIQTPRYYVNGEHTLLENDPLKENLLLTKQRHQCKFMSKFNYFVVETLMPIKKYFAQRSPQTGDLVSKPWSKFMPSNIQTYPTLICRDYAKKQKWKSSRKALCLCRMKI